MKTRIRRFVSALGDSTRREEIEKVADLVIRSVAKLRALSPLWEMHQEGH